MNENTIIIIIHALTQKLNSQRTKFTQTIIKTQLMTSDLGILKSLSFEADVTATIPKYRINSTSILLISFLRFSISLGLFNILFNENHFHCTITLPISQRRTFPNIGP